MVNATEVERSSRLAPKSSVKPLKAADIRQQWPLIPPTCHAFYEKAIEKAYNASENNDEVDDDRAEDADNGVHTAADSPSMCRSARYEQFLTV